MSFKEFIKLSWSKVILTIILLILGFFFTINFRDGDVVTAFGFPMILLAILLSYINNNCYAKSYTPH